MNITPIRRARRYTHRMDQLQNRYWETWDQWTTGKATTKQLEDAHTAWATEWLHGL